MLADLSYGQQLFIAAQQGECDLYNVLTGETLLSDCACEHIFEDGRVTNIFYGFQIATVPLGTVLKGEDPGLYARENFPAPGAALADDRMGWAPEMGEVSMDEEGLRDSILYVPYSQRFDNEPGWCTSDQQGVAQAILSLLE